MANKKDRIMDLMRRGIISEDEALELLESQKEEKASESKENQRDKKESFSYQDKEGYTNHDIDFPDAFKSVISQIADGAKDLFKGISKAVDENIDFANGFPKVKSISKTIEKDIEGDFDAVNIALTAGKLSVQPGDNAHVKVDYKVYGAVENGDVDSYLAEKSKLEVIDEVLEITTEAPGRISADVALYLPEKTYKDIAVKLTHGDSSFSKTEAEKLSLSIVNGQIELKETQTSELFVSNKNGDIRIEDGRADELKLSLVNGDIRVTSAFGRGDISLVNGDILLTQDSNSPRELNVKSVNGDIKLSVPEDLGLVGHVKTIFGGYKTRLKLDSPFEAGRNGAALVRNSEQSLTFEIETKSGTIWLKDNESKEEEA
ncbi:DUF4097 family beta strand repeat-containing protein [Lactococcus termiticola]|uniref:DUF4097 domain-containing protein n=1 Tax=Lactococcus termiticola TaxID=2169526 RepID=A0A2R5HHW5_9LACT|nr:DUF4097 domain-containing protein [Lactococcus termiticola]GBG96985.1 hypothetical protein NtB2_01122 [Lactococcus termiticola]